MTNTILEDIADMSSVI